MYNSIAVRNVFHNGIILNRRSYANSLIHLEFSEIPSVLMLKEANQIVLTAIYADIRL